MHSRIHAGLVHLGLSASLVSLIAVLVLLLWYPAPYAAAMGVSNILLLLAAVDIVIGPLLTLIVFDSRKRSLKFDLAVIGMLQLAALAYGAGAVFSGRPVFLVYNVDRFTVVSSDDIPAAERARAPGLGIPLAGPRLVGVRLPADRKEQNRILFSAVNGGADLAQMPQFYLPYAAVADEVKVRLLSLEQLLGQRASVSAMQARRQVIARLAQSGLALAEVGFLPLRAKARDMTVIVRRADAAIVAILPLDPWGA